MRAAARDLSEKFGASFLVKGGHLRANTATDVLFANGKLREFSSPFTKRVATHGTGCTYSAAITAGLARGLALDASIARAKRFVSGAIKNHFRWKTRAGSVAALNHFQKV
jgi:hydroxymethylpyrimidine/phosphomethylpyrimidine kinase